MPIGKSVFLRDRERERESRREGRREKAWWGEEFERDSIFFQENYFGSCSVPGVKKV